MRFGIHLTNHGPATNTDSIATLARSADELGYDSIWVSDHVVVPDRFDSVYPFRGNPFTPESWGRVHEPLITLAFVAALTSRVRLGLSVLIAPQRNPVLTAKQLATIDSLSVGRLDVGVGAGWLAEEFAALDSPFERRGSLLDEYIEIFKTLWTEDVASFSGRHYSFDALHCEPKPANPGGPPVTVGGHSRAALRRAAALDGWQAVRLAASEVAQPVQALRELASERSKSSSSLQVLVRCDVDIAGEVDDSEVWRLAGPPDHVSELIAAYSEAGVTDLVFTVAPERPVGARVETIARLAEEVLPSLRSDP
jgi:probable F420-dependent oxidoreductase